MVKRKRLDKLNSKTMQQEYKDTYETILRKGHISNELELERAFIIERKIRLLIEESPNYKENRRQLRNLITEYESKNWSNDSAITEKQIKENDDAKLIAEEERVFFRRRETIIKEKLKQLNLTQQDLSIILKYKKSSSSQLMNAIYSFAKSDLIIIHKLFDIKLEDLIYTKIPQKEVNRIENTIVELGRKDLISRLYGSEKPKKANF